MGLDQIDAGSINSKLNAVEPSLSFRQRQGFRPRTPFNEKPLRGRQRAYPSVDSLDQLWRASQVFGPTMPSAGVAKTDWNALTAASV